MSHTTQYNLSNTRAILCSAVTASQKPMAVATAAAAASNHVMLTKWKAAKSQRFSSLADLNKSASKLVYIGAFVVAVTLSLTLALIAPSSFATAQPLSAGSLALNAMLPPDNDAGYAGGGSDSGGGVGGGGLGVASNKRNAANTRRQASHHSTSNDASSVKGQIFKRSFVGLGCLGVYDKSKFARLDRVCEDCYQLYREPDIHAACRADCFRNDMFSGCVDALLLSNDQKKLSEMVEELYGK